MNFWTRVDNLLFDNNITRKELAMQAGFDVSNIGKGISNNNCPSAETAVKIAQVLHTSVEYLVTGKDSLNSQEGKENLDTLYRYSHTIHSLENIPEPTRKPIINMISDLSSKYKKDE